jgi:hypothetical protein
MNKNITFKLRNINNYLIKKLLDIFLYFYNNEHNIIPSEEKSEINEITNITIKRKDLYEFNIPNFISSFAASSKKGTQTENQDSYFYYNNFF